MARATDPVAARQAATWIVRKLRDAGHIAYFAGGCVRDGLLGLHPTDFDVATDAPPLRVRGIFPHTAEVGAAFGVVLVHVRAAEYANGGPPPATRTTLTQGGQGRGTVSVEVATFRSDGPYSDARRPDTVKFSDPESDAARRDFTINALYLDPLAPVDDASKAIAKAELHGRVIDFVGGLADLKARVIRAVGDADKRLAEDHLRAPRAVRFAARLGFAIDPATAAAITRHAAELRGVSRERIGEEMPDAAHPSRAAALEMLGTLGLDAVVMMEQGVQTALPVARTLPVDAGVVVALAAWVIDREGARQGRSRADWLSDLIRKERVLGWRTALCLSNEETEEVEGVLGCTWAIAQRWGAMRVSEKKRSAARGVFGESLVIVRAWDPTIAGRVEVEVSQLAADGIGIDPPPLVTGDDLVAAGMKPGPHFKRILDEVRDAQLEGDLREKSQGLELAARLYVKYGGDRGMHE